MISTFPFISLRAFMIFDKLPLPELFNTLIGTILTLLEDDCATNPDTAVPWPSSSVGSLSLLT